MAFCVLILGFTGCTSVEYQRMQNERDTRREVYEDVRRKEAFQRSRDFLSDDMLGKWEFLDITIEERGGSEDILKAKAALTASRLKGFRLRFWKNGANYFYRIENLITKSYGTYRTGSVYKGDQPQTGLTLIRFYPISGSQIPDLLFNFAKGTQKQVLFGDGEVHTTIIGINALGISVKAERLDLTLDLGMVLSPDGWLQRGNIRCSFQRIVN